MNKSNLESLISQRARVSPTYKWPFVGSRNEDAALGQNECDSPAELLLSLPLMSGALLIITDFIRNPSFRGKSSAYRYWTLLSSRIRNKWQDKIKYKVLCAKLTL